MLQKVKKKLSSFVKKLPFFKKKPPKSTHSLSKEDYQIRILKSFEKYYCSHCKKLIDYNVIVSHMKNHEENSSQETPDETLEAEI